MAIRERVETAFGEPYETVRDRAHAHTMAAQAWLSTRVPEAMTGTWAGGRYTSSGLPRGLLNLVLDGQFDIGMGEAEIEAAVDAMGALYAGRGVPWDWWVGPTPTPHHLPELLERWGFATVSLPCMAKALDREGWRRRAMTPVSPIHVWRARDFGDLRAASAVRRQGFSWPDGVAETYFEDTGDDWLAGDPARLFMAGRREGQAEAIGAWIRAGGMGGVYVMAVLPDAQRQGLGQAILRALIDDAQQAGETMLALTASKKGFGLYQQFGFMHLFDYQVFYRHGDR